MDVEVDEMPCSYNAASDKSNMNPVTQYMKQLSAMPDSDSGADSNSDVEVADKQKALAEHEAKANDAASAATMRQRANDALVAQTPYLSALGKMRQKIGECFQVLLLWNRWQSTPTTLSIPPSTMLCETTQTRKV